MKEGRMKKYSLLLVLILSISFFSTFALGATAESCVGGDFMLSCDQLDLDAFCSDHELSDGKCADGISDRCKEYRYCLSEDPSGYCTKWGDYDCVALEYEDIGCYRLSTSDCETNNRECNPLYKSCGTLNQADCNLNEYFLSCDQLDLDLFCSDHELSDGTCADGVSDRCKEHRVCLIDTDGYCTKWGDYNCVPMDYQDVQCNTLTETECSSYRTCDPYYQDTFPCYWDEVTCQEGETKTFQSCSGTYDEEYLSCEGQYEECYDSAGNPINAFFAIITGNPIADCTGTIITEDCQQQHCEDPVQLGCFYQTKTRNASCDFFDESSCLSHGGCSPSYSCEGEVVIDEKAGECEKCEINSDCQDGLSCREMLGTTTKICVQSDQCAVNTADATCSVVGGTNQCQGGDLYGCQGIDDWSLLEDCASGECISGECTIIPEDPTPTLLWKNKDDGTTYQTSMNNPITVNFPDLPLNLQTWVEDPDMSKDDTFTIYENADLLESGTGSTNSDGIYLRDFTITRDLAETLQANEYDIYEFQYKVFEDTSSTFHLRVTGLGHCDNTIQDYDEKAVDCGGLDCEACCGNGVCDPEIENYTTCPVDCSAPNVKEAKWGVSSPLTLDPQSLVDGVNLEMWLYYADNPETATFGLKEQDDFPNTDDLIFEDRLGTPKGDTDTLYNWTATLNDFKLAHDQESDNVYQFIFEAEGEPSNELEIRLTDPLPTCDDGITNGDEEGVDCGGSCEPCSCVTETLCSDYKDSESCNNDACDLGLGCSWNAEKGVCGVKVNVVSDDGVDIGACYYTDNMGEDTCDDDGYLSYSVDANWQWASDNVEPEKPEASGWIQDDITGDWHYDPKGDSAKCQDAEKTIACPAQVQLSFLNWKNLLAAILLIMIIYVAINIQKQNKKHKKQMQQKTMKKIKRDVDKDNKPKTTTKKKPTTKKKATTKKKSATNKKSTKKPTKKKTTSKKKK